jgi:transglutaminase-like putative cysteine protease
MNRRDFLQRAQTISAGLAFLPSEQLIAERESEGWRTFEVTTRIEVLKPSGVTRIWMPEALLRNTPYQKTIVNSFHCDNGVVKVFRNEAAALGIVAAEFPAQAKPVLTVRSVAATRNWAVNFSMRDKMQRLSSSERAALLRPTKMLPTDGIVKQKATAITRNASTDIDKARAIYEWIVENTYRNPKTRGCGAGNIRFMLESGDLGGKCADLNGLYVGLARAAGLPARDVYGIRVVPSEMGCKSLGTSSATVTKAQHCRAEVYLTDYGWVPVDPADVRKVMLEEAPGNRRLDDEIVRKARSRLFGSWEMNWIAYNFAQDVSLPGSSGPAVHFLMYPQAETAEGRLDSLDADSFRYEIMAREIAAADG